MGKPVKAYQVDNLAKVDTTRYTEGSLFITDRSIAILSNGTIKPLQTSPTNLKNYVKKSEVQKMIDEAMKQKGE